MEFELITAILAGDNSLEMRVFTPHEINATEEGRLTTRLCKLMNNWNTHWKRYILTFDSHSLLTFVSLVLLEYSSRT